MYRAKLIFIVALVVGAVESGPATFNDLLDFFNTTSRIYVYATTYVTYIYDNPVTCIWYSKKYLNDTCLTFNIRYKADWRTYDMPVNAKLGDDPDVGGPYMEPNFWPKETTFRTREKARDFSTDKDESVPARRTLFFNLRDLQCAVFTMPRRGKIHCELHLWESAIIKEGPYHHVNFTCLKHFQALCGDWPTCITYTHSCNR
ncbi:uncharacterized protein LOC125947339 [Dermacentor silvarum]|uniref:uncharacterized protein LOC125947339 n=1 Tax=Dermacentor silvarum TaxID=543639 RepID=UPI0021006C76|nr:uncharacterized protein LOC125947339 [Dermacentor silvarum]